MSEELATPTFGKDESVYTGRVKWFNNRAGYGFITVKNAEDNEDLFVHHTAINVGSEQYKYLVEGEYISFKKIASENSEHKFQAGEVTGVEGGQLMCETRNHSRSVRTEKSGKDPAMARSRPVRTGRSFSAPDGETRQKVLVRGSGPREEWYLVKRRARGGGDERKVPRNKVDTSNLVQEEE